MEKGTLIQQKIQQLESIISELKELFPEEVEIDLNTEIEEKQTEKIPIKLKKANTNKTQEDMAKIRTKEEDNTQILLDNGMVGKAYSDKITAELIGKEQFFILELSLSSKVEGLEFNIETGEISGTPKSAGDFIGTLCYKLGENDDEKYPELNKEVLITINPDPNSLWKNLPTDENAPYQKDNTYAEVISTEKHKIIGASIRGRSHAHIGSFRDDHFINFVFEESQWTLQAVADGAGSAKYSRQGSKIACETLKQGVEDYLSGDDFKSLEENLVAYYSKTEQEDEEKENLGRTLSQQVYTFLSQTSYESYKVVKGFAEDKQQELKDFSTTLLFTLSKEFEFGTIVLSTWIGDGVICVYTNDKFETLGEPDGGEYAGQTRFLTMSSIFQEGFEKRISLNCYKEKPTAIILMTDGISDPYFETDEGLKDGEKWESLWNDLNDAVLSKSEEEEFKSSMIDWLGFPSKGHHDDRTISILS
ncbi:PP2C family serine/threonine-protein phosphatase [Flammeovirga aprica]|nr:PP2C family serine/threonine-protein phosphatase [Flammeovirga aprica]